MSLSSEVRAQDTCAIEGFTPPARQSQEDVLAQWNSEAAALAPFGAPATFDLDATELHVTFEGGGALVAPVNVVGIEGVFSIEDAVIDGVGAGRVDVSGAATLANATASSAVIAKVDVAAAVMTMDVLADPLALALSGASVSGYLSAVLVDDSGAVTTLGPSFTLASAPADALTTSGLVRLRVDNASVSSAGPLAFAGDFTGGALAVEGETFTTQARSILAASGDVAIDTTGIVGSARVTQVFDDAAPLMQADIEVVVLAPVAYVAAGSSVNIPAVVRNRSARSMAILSGIEVDGCGASAVTPVVDTEPPSMVAILIGAIEQSGWAAPFVALAVAPLLGAAIVTDAFVAVADAFVDVIGDIFCGLFGCDGGGDPPPEPVPPIPYPKWLAPGQVAAFEIALLPQIGDDDYPTRVRFIGNHPEAHVDFTLRVGQGDVPFEWQCGLDQWGTADGCHCGCGVRDSDCPTGGDASLASCDFDACTPGLNHLEESNIDVCVEDPQPPPPDFDDDFDDDDFDDDFDPFDCSSSGGSSGATYVALGLVILLARRRGGQPRAVRRPAHSA